MSHVGTLLCKKLVTRSTPRSVYSLDKDEHERKWHDHEAKHELQKRQIAQGVARVGAKTKEAHPGQYVGHDSRARGPNDRENLPNEGGPSVTIVPVHSCVGKKISSCGELLPSRGR